MYNIVLICTVHTELGKCNSKELYKIIEIIEPEVIFEELSVSIFNQCYNEQRHSNLLEQNAIKEYLKKYQIEHIPVDTYEIPNSYYSDCEYKLKQIFNKNIEYTKLLNNHSSLVKQGGFKFLNNSQSDLIFQRISVLEKNIIDKLNNENLSYLYRLRIDTDDKRENEMLNNIYNFSNNCKYNKALMFTGAWHKIPLIKKINDYINEKELKLNWILE